LSAACKFTELENEWMSHLSKLEIPAKFNVLDLSSLTSTNTKVDKFKERSEKDKIAKDFSKKAKKGVEKAKERTGKRKNEKVHVLSKYSQDCTMGYAMPPVHSETSPFAEELNTLPFQ